MRLFSAVGLVVALWLPAVAFAQAPPDDPTEEEILQARASFVSGADAVDEGRWADAVGLFSRAYELSGAPPALFNVGLALRALGRHVDAREAFERLLARHRDQLDPDMRARSLELLAEVRRRITHVIVRGLDPDLRYDLRFDGLRLQDSGQRPLRLETDAGTHSFRASLEGKRPYVWEGRLADGERIDLEVELSPGEGERSVLRHPALWIVVGTLVIGAGVTAGVLLQRDAQLEPMSDRRFQL